MVEPTVAMKADHSVELRVASMVTSMIVNIMVVWWAASTAR